MGGHGVRPTKRCLDDLGVDVPTADVPLHQLPAAPVAAAQALPERLAAGGVTRIRSLKDRVWFKVKTGRWRGAAVQLVAGELAWRGDDDGRLMLASLDRWWLGAVGYREDGSPRDFYEELATSSACSRSWKPQGIDTDPLLPQEWDRKRVALERALAERRVYQQVMIEAAARSLRSGKIVTASFSRYEMGALVRADRGEQYVAFIARGVFDPRVLAVMLDSLPGISNEHWQPEPGGAFGLEPQCGEVIYSAVLPSDVADSILERVPWSEE